MADAMPLMAAIIFSNLPNRSTDENDVLRAVQIASMLQKQVERAASAPSTPQGAEPASASAAKPTHR